jgi:hypothetical protein
MTEISLLLVFVILAKKKNGEAEPKYSKTVIPKTAIGKQPELGASISGNNMST